jgi:type I restriction enzyme, S subunit
MELTATKYKQTEVGLIPEDWDLVPFDKVFTFHSTSNYSKAQMSDDDEVGCIHYGLIHAIPNTQYNLKNGIKYYVSSDQAKYDFVRDGDVIMVDASEDLEGVNKSVEVCGIGNKKYISGLHTYLLRDKNGSLADNFRGILLNSQLVKNQMLQLAVGMKVFGVSKTQLIKVKLPLPPTITEQKVIAQVLSDTDALIQALEKKIAKKKHIKKGVMQKLLTPTDDWIESKVASVGQPYGGMSGKTKADFSNGNAHYVPFMNVMSNPITDTGYLDSVNINKGESQNKIIKGDLLFNGSSETPEEVGLCSAVLAQIDNLF